MVTTPNFKEDQSYNLLILRNGRDEIETVVSNLEKHLDGQKRCLGVKYSKTSQIKDPSWSSMTKCQNLNSWKDKK